MTKRERPEVLIERWLPVETIGAESMRERGASSALPPLYFLHVWWARRPLAASRAAILASVLPAWSKDWPKKFQEMFPTELEYQRWFLKALGVQGNPARGRKLLQSAREKGVSIPNPYDGPRAFVISPSDEILDTISDLFDWAWGTRTLTVLDPFSGGGSIPFESMRYGFTTYANELNPVATIILKATLEYPHDFGPGLADDIQKYGGQIARIVQNRLRPFFSPIEQYNPKAEGAAYLWVRTVQCPYTGKTIPLSLNWWLQKGSDPVAVRPIFPHDASEATFEIVRGKAACDRARPDKGTASGGDGISPWANNQAVDCDYIKAEARAGRMGQQLYAIAIKRKGGFDYRAPVEEDCRAVRNAEAELRKCRPIWEKNGLFPLEALPMDTESWTHGNTPAQYGAAAFCDLFAPRQLLSLCALTEAMNTMRQSLAGSEHAERVKAISTLMGIALSKAVNYNARTTFWDYTRQKIAHGFSRHDFAFRYCHAEFDAACNFVPWIVDQIADAYSEICRLSSSSHSLLKARDLRALVTITNGTAADLSPLQAASVNHICTDPPYNDNVMYAELSDFFYVWLKKTLGDVHPDLFVDALTNKEDEAVANHARFASVGRKKKELALRDYQNKMAAAFREMHRVLRDDGVLTVMFTHKKVEAWDSLATSLVGAGFTIHSSWPVHTESDHSLHQAKKNAAKSTILLSCRKRLVANEPVWWDDIKERVRRTAREKAEAFARQGIKGVDLYIATFGPTLAILSENWPVLTSEADEVTGEPKPLRPEVALDLAREQVIAFRKRGLLLDKTIQFDPVTDWYLMAWDAFKAAEFPADEARKLALALGLDLERQLVAEKRLISKKGSFVQLKEPADRRKKGMVDPDKTSFDCLLDAAHTAMLLYLEDGAKSCETFLREAGLLKDEAFKALLQALMNAIPRTQQRGKFSRPEAAALDSLRDAFFEYLIVPIEEEPVRIERQDLFKGHGFEVPGEEELPGDDVDEDGEEGN